MIPRLVAITPGDGRALAPWLRAVAPHVDAVVLREPELPAPALRDAVRAVRDAGSLAIVHARSGPVPGDGVHVPDGHPVPTGTLAGASCHDAEGLDRAFARGATYAFLSPVWAPTSKATRVAPLGVARFCALAAGRSVLGLGGVSVARCALLASRGYGSAVLGGLFGVGTPEEAAAAARAYRDACATLSGYPPAP